MKNGHNGHTERAQWREGTIGDFLELSDARVAVIEVAVVLARRLREARTAAGLSQAELARRMNTQQPAIARLEAASEVTLDLLVRALLECGATLTDVAEAFGEAQRNLPQVQHSQKAMAKVA